MAITNSPGNSAGSSNLALSLKLGANQSIAAADLLGDLPPSAYTFRVGRSGLGQVLVDEQGSLTFTAAKVGKGRLTVDILENGKRVATRRINVETLPLSTRIETFSNLQLEQPRVASFSNTSFISLFENEGFSFKPGAINVLSNIDKRYQLKIETISADKIRIGAYDNKGNSNAADDEQLQVMDLAGSFTLSGNQELVSGTVNRIDAKYIDSTGDTPFEVTDVSIQDLSISVGGKDIGKSFLTGLRQAFDNATEFKGSSAVGQLSDSDISSVFSDEIRTGSRNDRIFSGAGDDVIWAGGGNDLIDAGTGDDQIHSGTGRDEITGGLGADTFIYDATSLLSNRLANVDLIRDFNAEQGDVIEIKRSGFKELQDFAPGALSASSFVQSIGARDAANKTPVFGFEAATGALFYQARAGDPRSVRYIATLAGVSKFEASSINLV